MCCPKLSSVSRRAHPSYPWKFQRITQAELKLVFCHIFPICQLLRMKDDWQTVWLVNFSIKHSKIWKDRCYDDQRFHVLYFTYTQTLTSLNSFKLSANIQLCHFSKILRIFFCPIEFYHLEYHKKWNYRILDMIWM